MKNKKFRLWLSRFCVFVVLFFNLQAAFEFIFRPNHYVSSFELNGVPGLNMISGMGILFLMWNIPYIFALFQPVRNRISLYEAVLMQATGVIGESILLFRLPEGHAALVRAASRFIIFDGAGLILLFMALLASRENYRQYKIFMNKTALSV